MIPVRLSRRQLRQAQLDMKVFATRYALHNGVLPARLALPHNLVWFQRWYLTIWWKYWTGGRRG